MPAQRNLWQIPEWYSVGREAALVRHLVGSGVTALGRANYADKIGEYYTAFFGLSVGMERLAKLILVTDYSIANSGRMPEEKVVRKFGHKLADLLKAVDEISQRQNLELTYERPFNSICSQVVECLDSFADAGRGRYANFAALGDPNLNIDEPIQRWWRDVAEMILRKHYYGKPAQQRIESRAKQVDELTSPFMMVRYINESGDLMQDVFSASVRTGQTEIVQRYGRYYTLVVIRWLADVFREIADAASYTHGINAFYGASEYVQTYTVEDNFLRTRKVWPLN